MLTITSPYLSVMNIRYHHMSVDIDQCILFCDFHALAKDYYSTPTLVSEHVLKVHKFWHTMVSPFGTQTARLVNDTN